MRWLRRIWRRTPRRCRHRLTWQSLNDVLYPRGHLLSYQSHQLNVYGNQYCAKGYVSGSSDSKASRATTAWRAPWG